MAICLLASCGKNGTETTEKLTETEYSATETENIEGDTEETRAAHELTEEEWEESYSACEGLSAVGYYQAVLLNELPFVWIKDDSSVFFCGYLSDLVTVEPSYEVTEFAVMDMDGDGVDDLALRVGPDSYQLLLRVKDGKVCAYDLGSSRGVRYLKEDGSFTGSAGEAYSYVARIYFVGDEMKTACELYRSSGIRLLNGISVDEETYEAQLDAFEERTLAPWHNYTEDLILKYCTDTEDGPAGETTARQEYLDSLSDLCALAAETTAEEYYDGCLEEMNDLYEKCLEILSGDERDDLEENQREWQETFDTALADRISGENLQAASIDDLSDPARVYLTFGDFVFDRIFRLANVVYGCAFYG